MQSTVFTFLDIAGTIVFAISGALAAMERKLDPFGVIIIAFVTAIGGGTLRDVLVGNLPVSWLENRISVNLIFGSAVATMIFGSVLRRLETTLFVFDALGLGLFTLAGIAVAQRYGLSTGICIALGTITACFGGVLRDVLLNRVPLIFEKEIYALAAAAGGALYFALLMLKLPPSTAEIIAIGFIFGLRVLAVRYNWSLPAPKLKGNP